jgi:hypothetical protein
MEMAGMKATTKEIPMSKNVLNGTAESIEAKELRKKSKRIIRNVRIAAGMVGVVALMTVPGLGSCTNPASSKTHGKTPA